MCRNGNQQFRCRSKRLFEASLLRAATQRPNGSRRVPATAFSHSLDPQPSVAEPALDGPEGSAISSSQPFRPIRGVRGSGAGPRARTTDGVAPSGRIFAARRDAEQRKAAVVEAWRAGTKNGGDGRALRLMAVIVSSSGRRRTWTKRRWNGARRRSGPSTRGGSSARECGN